MRAAHAASVLKVVEEGAIDAPPEKVWAILSDFAHADWLPGVTRVEAEGDNTPDKAKRAPLHGGWRRRHRDADPVGR